MTCDFFIIYIFKNLKKKIKQLEFIIVNSSCSSVKILAYKDNSYKYNYEWIS